MRKLQWRYTIIGILFVVAMGALIVRLFNLQFVNGEKNLMIEQNFSRKDIRLTGPRGKILDRNGLPLAYNKTSYNVEFVRNPALTGADNRAKYTQSFIKTIDIIEKSGGKSLSTFAIRRMDDGSYDFYWPSVDKNKDPKAYDSRVTLWKTENCKGVIKKADTPEQLVLHCREYYGIPADVSYEEAFKILSIWQEVQAVYYSSYLPVTLAENVDMNTVAEIEIRGNELTGVQISQSNSRVYPNKTMAAHIIGYMGRMLDERTIKQMKDLGYQRDDIVGQSGIEFSEETELSGNTADRTGTKVVEVDNVGKVVREITDDNKSPKPGNNVMLTIDSGMQKKLEEALAENIALAKSEQESAYNGAKAKYYQAVRDRGGWDKAPIQYAKVGAAVVMDAQTGDILAMASNPSYDPNLFETMLSPDDYNKYFGPGTNNPLFNNAISSRGTPGSIFKMCTGLAALAEGQLNLTEQISDGGPYDKYFKDNKEKAPSCWVKPYSKHADQTIVEGLKNSCNYFFFELADRLGVDRLNRWADLLGLTSKTGVELPSEVAGQMSNQQSLYSPTNMSGVASLVRKQVIGLMKNACANLGMNYDDDKYNAVALELLNIVNEGAENMGPDIRAILKNDMKLTSADIEKYNLDGQISMSLVQIRWDLNPMLTVESGIGQSVTLLTPIGVARYVSAIVNGGNVYEARLVKSIITPEGRVRNSAPKLIRNLGVDQAYLDAIMKGMQEVVSDEEGTATAYFTGYKYKDQIGGKTGTAQVNETIDLENNSWFVAFAPYAPDIDPTLKPEIVVVVYIPNGYKGALSSYTAKEAIQYYMDSKKLTNTPQPMPQANTLVN